MDSDNFVNAAGADDDVDDIGDDFDDLNLEETDEIETEEKEKASLFSNPIEALLKFHPECVLDYEEVDQPDIPLKESLKDNKHRSAPFLSTFEKTKILGMRTNQLAQGARPYIKVPEYITDVLEIAKLELEQRKLPIIIKRHMPDGSYEKYRLADLLIF